MLLFPMYVSSLLVVTEVSSDLRRGQMQLEPYDNIPVHMLNAKIFQDKGESIKRPLDPEHAKLTNER